MVKTPGRSGMQNANCMALHSLWNSVHLSTFMTPLVGGSPCHSESFSRMALMRDRTISNMDSPQQRRSRVSRSPSAAMSACYTTAQTNRNYHRIISIERNVLFNDALNTFYLRLYGVRHMVKDHSDSEKGNPLPPHRLLLSISSKGSFICTIPQTG